MLKDQNLMGDDHNMVGVGHDVFLNDVRQQLDSE
jgi:hypothetical protein